MMHAAHRLARATAPAIALALAVGTTPAAAEWLSVRTEGGMTAVNTDGNPAVPAVIAVCQRGTLFLYVNLALDPEQASRTIGFRGYASGRSSEESFVRDPATGAWVTQPSGATMALFADDEFTLQLTLSGMAITGIPTQGYSGQGQDPRKGVNAALAPVFAACPGWRQQASAAKAPPAIVPATSAPKPAARPKGRKSSATPQPRPPAPVTAAAPAPAPAPIPRPPAAEPAPIPLPVGYYAYVEGTFSTCAKPVMPPKYFDGTRFWDESDLRDPNHQSNPQALKWEMVAADRFRITSRSRNERGQWDGQVSVNEYRITGPQSFSFIGTVGFPMNVNERHKLCSPAELPASARWFKQPK